MLNVGDIVKLKNICFEAKEVDHAFRIGRPCVFVGEDDNNMYFLPITSNHKNNDKIVPNEINNLTKVSSINIRQLITKPVAFYDARGRIEEKYLIKAFDCIKKYHGKKLTEDGNTLIDIANEYLEKSKRRKYVDMDRVNKKIIK